jgi:hypothetical protein
LSLIHQLNVETRRAQHRLERIDERTLQVAAPGSPSLSTVSRSPITRTSPGVA